MLVSTRLSNITFHLLPIWLQFLGAIDSESCQTSFQSFACQVAVLFNSNLSRRPFFRQVVDSDLLLCTVFDLEHAVLFLCNVFTQRPTNDRRFERSNRRCFGRQQLLANFIGGLGPQRLPQSWKGPVFASSPVWPAQVVTGQCPKSSAIDFAFISFDCLAL